MCSSTNLRVTPASNIIPQVISAITGHLHSGNYFWKKLLLDAKGQRTLETKAKNWLLLGPDPHSFCESKWYFNSVWKDFDNIAFGIFFLLWYFVRFYWYVLTALCMWLLKNRTAHKIWSLQPALWLSCTFAILQIYCYFIFRKKKVTSCYNATVLVSVL